MSPESAATRIARLEEQMRTATEEARNTRETVRALAPTATIVAGHAIRLDDVSGDISEIKGLVRKLEDKCAKASDVTELKRALEDRSDKRQASRGIIIAAAVTGSFAVIGSIVTTLLTVLT